MSDKYLNEDDLVELKDYIDLGDTTLATDTTLGTVKLNPNESVTLNADGQLDVGGRLGQFSGTTGIFHGKDRAPRNVADYSLLITDALGIDMQANRSFAVVSGIGISGVISGRHPAGCTEYYIQNTYANRLMCAGLTYVSKDEATSKVQRIVPVVSITINGKALAPDSSENDLNNPIVITTAESLNPDSALTATNIRGFRSMVGYASEYIGSGVGADAGGANLILGQGAYSKSGNMNVLLGQYHYNQGNGNTLLGRQHISKKNRWLLAGTGHDNTNGKAEAGAAVGQYSDIKSTTAFAVGNGTSHTVRSNALEVLNDGRAKIGGTPTESDDIATKSYVDSAIGGGGMTFATFGNADFSYLNDCVAYSTVSGNANEPTATKYGRVVNLAGAFKNTVARPDNQPFDIGKVPAGCEPIKTQYILSQGSTQYKFMLTIKPDGTLNVSRYSATATNTAVPVNTWLNINATYISAT